MIDVQKLMAKAGCGPECGIVVLEVGGVVEVTHSGQGPSKQVSVNPKAAEWNQPEGPGWMTPIFEMVAEAHR